MPFWNKSTKKHRTKSCISREDGSDFLPGESYSLIKPENLLIQEKLVDGWYGTVEKGQWNRGGDKKEDVVIRSVARNAQGEVLLHVNKMLLLHPHIAILYGVSLPDLQLGLPLRLVTEYGRFGTLLKNLKETNKDICTVLSFHCYSVQIASGMDYLSKNNIVHEDLGAHNILVFEPDKIKITGFGLKTRDLEMADGPVTWNAPEVYTKREYSSASDVWSFGMLLWVMFSFGKSLLDNLNDKENSALSLVEPSQRLSRPQACPYQIYDIMISCWEQNPSNRPTFHNLHGLLRKFKLVQVKAISECKVSCPDHLNYNAGNKITLISSSSDERDLWFGQHQESRRLGFFEARNVKVIDDKNTRISEPFNFLWKKKEDVLKELNLDNKTIPRDIENPNYEDESVYVDMDNGKMDDKSTSDGTLVTSEYESLDYEANYKSKLESENCLYQVPLKLLTDSDSSIQQEGKRSVEVTAVNISGSQELPLYKNLSAAPSPTSDLQNSLPAKSRRKKVGSLPQVPERADLIEKGFQESETGFSLGRRALTTPRAKKSSAPVTKRPVPTPRSRVNSCPPIGMEHGSTVNKALLDDQGRTPVALQQRTDDPWNQKTKFLNETGDDTESLTEGDSCLNEKNRCVNLKYPDKTQMSQVADDWKLFETGRQWSELRPRSLPDGSDIPDSERIAELLSLADVDGEVDSNDDDDTPPPLPPKDILSRNLQTPSSSRDFFQLSHPDSYLNQITETRQNYPHTQDEIEVQSSNELPVSHFQEMQDFDSSFGIVRRSTPMPISSMAQTPSQSRDTCKGLSELSRPLPPVPASSMPETRANVISWEQFNSSSAPNYASSTPSLPKPLSLFSETDEQPIYDFLLPPVPLPPTIPMNVLNQSPPDYLPFSRNTPNVEKETGKTKENAKRTSADVNANVVSASGSEPEVLPFEELQQKYGIYAKAVEEIHKEFPYDYDTCHAWLVSYEGDKQKVLGFFKINMLMSFTCKSEGECRRALDLYKMDLHRAANHLFNSE